MTISETERLILRDLTVTDLISRERWETVDTEWQLWDAPWEYEGMTEEERKQDLQSYLSSLQTQIENIQKKSDTDIRWSFQIVEKKTGNYIGWVNAYNIDSEYNWTTCDGLLTLGIDLPFQGNREKGYGSEAFSAVIEYYKNRGYRELYTQTWSGNERMIHLAEKLGFKLTCRKPGLRHVRGKIYDGLTFRLDL